MVEYFKQGINDVQEMKQSLEMFVQNELFGGENTPSEGNSRFYPKKSTIRSHLGRIRSKMRYSTVDQERLQQKITEWKKNDPSVSIYFRPKVISDFETESNQEREVVDGKANSILFVYQTQWQKTILQRYGNEMLFLDSTYKSERYGLPWFLVVKTNIDYQIVGAFITEDESKSLLYEALSIIKKWNPSLKPRFVLADSSNEEIEALETAFSSMYSAHV